MFLSRDLAELLAHCDAITYGHGLEPRTTGPYHSFDCGHGFDPIKLLKCSAVRAPLSLVDVCQEEGDWHTLIQTVTCNAVQAFFAYFSIAQPC